MKTYLYNLPLKIRGFIVRENDSGEDTIILNARLTNEANKEAYIHELIHKRLGDLDSKESVSTIELRAHSLKRF